jgi:hypothetical protein
LKAEYISSNTKSGFKVGDSDEGAEFGWEHWLRDFALKSPILRSDEFLWDWEAECWYSSVLCPIPYCGNVCEWDERWPLSRCFSVWECHALCLSPQPDNDVPRPRFDDMWQVNPETLEHSLFWDRTEDQGQSEQGLFLAILRHMTNQ